MEMSVQPDPSALYVEHESFVRGCLRRMGVGADRVDDAAQDVFVVLVRRLADYEPDRGARQWLWGIARRVAWSHLRKARRTPESLAGQVATPTPQWEERVRVRHFLSVLDDPQREAFVLHDVVGHTAREIAEQLELPLTTVQWRIRSARTRLRGQCRGQTVGAWAWLPQVERFLLRMPNLVGANVLLAGALLSPSAATAPPERAPTSVIERSVQGRTVAAAQVRPTQDTDLAPVVRPEFAKQEHVWPDGRVAEEEPRVTRQAKPRRARQPRAVPKPAASETTPTAPEVWVFAELEVESGDLGPRSFHELYGGAAP
jgi:RNA polymerase sigma-70 factor (ECF subfamily)